MSSVTCMNSKTKFITSRGFIIIAALTVLLLSINGDNQSVTDLIESTLTSARLFTSLLPIALVISLAISISNLVLMKHEGVCLQNMLGFFLGIVLCVGTVIPYFIYPLFDSLGIDVHRYSSLTLLLEIIIEDMISVIMAYFECILIGTSVSAVRAAKHIPAFNKDFILIHGCQITDDGGLTKLLRSRADRAVEFADMQKKKRAGTSFSCRRAERAATRSSPRLRLYMITSFQKVSPRKGYSWRTSPSIHVRTCASPMT